MFQVLQAEHVPSKLLFFQDENHWVLKPANDILWYHTVLDWLDQWVKPERAEYEKQLKTVSTEANAEHSSRQLGTNLSKMLNSRWPRALRASAATKKS